MIVSLDLGATEFRSLRQQSNCLVGRKSLAVYAALPSGESEQSLLAQMCIPSILCDDSLIVLGTAAVDLSRALRIPCVPLLVEGRVPSEDPLGRQLVSTLIDTLLPDAIRPTVCGLISRQAVDHASTDDLRFYSQVLHLKGYTPSLISTAEALAFAELGHSAFSGIVLDWGGEGASVALYRMGQPLAETVLPLGGRQIDERLAKLRDRYRWGQSGERYLDTMAIESWKQSSSVRVDRPRSEDEKLLSELIRDQMKALFYKFGRALNHDAAAITAHQSQTLVCGGSGPRIAGFAELLGQVIHETGLPLTVSEIQICPTDPFRMARGALIGLQLESNSLAVPQVA